MADQIKTLVYIGQRPSFNDAKKLIHVFHEIEAFPHADMIPEIDLTNEILFSKLTGLHHVVGGIYEIPVTPKGDDNYSWGFYEAKRLGHWPEESQIAAWKTTDWANQVAVGREKSLFKKDKMDYLLEYLLPLREEYSGLRGNSKIVFELRVLSALRRAP